LRIVPATLWCVNRGAEDAPGGEVPEQAPRSVQLRRVLFGGVHREDAAALQELLEGTQSELRLARSAFEESVGWAERLPAALSDLARLAAGDSAWDDPEAHFAAVIKDLAGAHLLTEVEIASVYAEGSTGGEQHTEWRAPDTPLRTDVRVGTRLCRCTWSPQARAGEETSAVIENLCRAVLFSLSGLDAAGERARRWIVTQLADGRAYDRAVALRERLSQPTARLAVYVDPASAGEHREVYGQVAWEASFADAAAVMEEVANSAGGQAYQTDGHVFVLLLDPARAEDTEGELRERLADRELRFDVRRLD
jgi:hypothetical protein